VNNGVPSGLEMSGIRWLLGTTAFSGCGVVQDRYIGEVSSTRVPGSWVGQQKKAQESCIKEESPTMLFPVAALALALTQQPQPAPPAAQARDFKDATLTIADGDKSKEVDVTVHFGAEKMQLVKGEGDKRQSLKDLPYTACKSAEYSYSKSPRWKSGLLISPFLFMSSGKKPG
jgi:hypothetical protein